MSDLLSGTARARPRTNATASRRPDRGRPHGHLGEWCAARRYARYDATRLRRPSTTYDYAGQDPINGYDLNGQWCWGCVLHVAEEYLPTLAGIGGGIVGFAICGPGCAYAGAAIAAGTTNYVIEKKNGVPLKHIVVDTVLTGISVGLDQRDYNKDLEDHAAQKQKSSITVVTVHISAIYWFK